MNIEIIETVGYMTASGILLAIAQRVKAILQRERPN
jgi:hypothetical protein